MPPVLWTLAALAALLLFAEAGCRAFIRTRGRYHVWKPGTRLLLRLDRDVLPEMEPEVRFEINRDGERGGRPPPHGDRDTYRVLVAGGSAAECYFLDQPTSWPGGLERLLSRPDALRRLGRQRVHVGNIAKSLYGSEYLDQIFEKILPHREALDLVVIMVGATDVVAWLAKGAPPEIPDRPVPLDALFAEHPGMAFGWHPRTWAVAEVARRARLRGLRRPEVREKAGQKLGEVRAMRARGRELRTSIPDPGVMLDRFERFFRRVLERAAARARVVVVHQPCFDRPHTPEEEAHFWGCGIGIPYHEEVTIYYSMDIVGRLMAAMNERAARVAGELGIEGVDLMPVLEKSLATYYDFFHLTPAGSRRVAETVAEAVLRRHPAPAAAGPSRS